MNESEVKITLCIIRCLAAVVVAAIVCTAGCTVYRDKMFKEGGYSMESVPGNAGTVWVKKPQ
jgi:hypothetical protein